MTGETVAVVDDDVSILRALQRRLSAAGFTVETFASAEAFLAAAGWSGMGCLVLDVNLRGLGGLELYERVKRTGSAIPAVFITAHQDPAVLERIRASGAAACLVKPIDGDALVAALRRALPLA
jgi:FixJ family two-component response regulator